jgi:hypothetical protein
MKAICILLVGLLGVPVPNGDKTSQLATALLDSLSAGQRQKATRAMDDEERKHWQFVPAARQGVTIKELDAGQRSKAIDLLKSSVSEAGFKKVETIRELENVLFELENHNLGRDHEMYYFTVFGAPSNHGDWAWRFEGHHVSLNFTYHDGKLVSSTPQFLGANPAEVMSSPKKGLRALPKEHDLAFRLIDLMSPEQRAKAVSNPVAPGEIVTSNQRKVGILERVGLGYKDMTKAEQAMLRNLVEAHAEVQSDSERSRRLKQVDYSSVVFAWMGSTEPGKGHYYRIQGSKFLIEYDDTQNNANHIHTVWRDFDGDFGEDKLLRHYAQSHRHGG